MTQIRMLIENRKSTKILVFVEPEASDYWLDSGELCELIADSEVSDGKFEIQYTDEGLTVYPDRGVGYISVYQDGKELECGHKRPANY